MNGSTADNCATNNHNNSTQHTTGIKQYMCLAHAFIKVQLGATSNRALWTPIWAKQAAAATGTVEAFYRVYNKGITAEDYARINPGHNESI